MTFRLNKKTEQFLTESTGIDYCRQVVTPMEQTLKGITVEKRKSYFCKSAQKVSPRGSVYLQVGRVLSFQKVKNLIEKI